MLEKIYHPSNADIYELKLKKNAKDDVKRSTPSIHGVIEEEDEGMDSMNHDN